MEKARYKILVADDSQLNLQLLREILEPQYNVVVATTGVEALRQTVEERPDLILLDIIMPEMNGFEVLAALKASKATRAIPVIVITGLDNERDEERGLELSAADYISKPFNPTSVILRVRNQIQIISHLREIEEFRNREILINVLNGIDASIAVIDPETSRILFVNDGGRIYQNADGDCVGQLCHKVIQACDAPCEGCPRPKLRQNPESSVIWEYNDSVTGGIQRKKAKMIDWVGGKKVQLEYAVDITEERNMEKNLQQLESEVEKVYYDSLTGINNRRYFEENIERVIMPDPRGASVVSLMMVDIDYFKLYNDTFGHVVGDICLKMIAEILQSCTMREGDFVARYGGEEFVVVLPNTSEQGARAVAQKILEAIRKRYVPHPKSEVSGCVTVSIGAVTGRVADAHSRDAYVTLADEMLYKSKASGRNRYTFTMLGE